MALPPGGKPAATRGCGDAGDGRSADRPPHRYDAEGTAVTRAVWQAGGARYWRGWCRCCGGGVWYSLPEQELEDAGRGAIWLAAV
ncbi:MAG: hypothetical protein KA362_03085 [Chloroflexi bacterium]|nr:hypothetical protein [Chloroflexota bacterium]MBP6803073.1 hypothetical protein [Chloroflexota bacterium]